MGNTILRTDARNRPTTYTLDALNRAVGQLYLDGTRVTITFDAARRQIKMQDVTGITTNAYDANSRLTSVLYPTGKALTYSFDPVGNRVSLLDPDGGLTTYSWDAQNRLIGIVNPFAETATLTYDALDRELRKTLGNGLAVSHTYDPAGRETLMENRNATGAGLAVYTATYDNVGNRLTVLELDGTRVTYGYDPAYQLINEQRSGANAYNTTYAYDPVGNRLSMNASGQITAYSFNAANELTLLTPPSGAPTTSTYDANGNLTLENTGGALTSYSWDGENRLLTVAAGSSIETYTYSADGMRQEKVTGSGTVFYVRDGQNVLIETNASLVTQVKYTDLPEIWGGKFSIHQSGQSSFYVPDQQGNTRQLTNSGQAVTDLLLTNVWGVEIVNPVTTNNPFKAFGQWGYYRDNATRLYVRARHLRVDLGRWISRDPVARWSDYAYADSRPITEIDPTGLAGCPDKYDCSSDVLKHISDLCQKITDFDPKKNKTQLDDIQSCIDRTLDPRFQGKLKCGSLKADALMSCLKTWCQDPYPKKVRCNNPIVCAQGGSDEECGHAFPNTSIPGDDQKHCIIVLCSDKTDKREYEPGKTCLDVCGDQSIPALEFTLLHEVFHCTDCGVGHGTDPTNPKGPESDLTCNDVVACCVYDVLFKKPFAPACTNRLRKPCNRKLRPM